MILDEFKISLLLPAPPEGLSGPLKAMWYDGRDDWESAHNIAQDISSVTGSWIHAYLHRKEGDEGNAAYWYRRAGKPFPDATLPEEWEAIVHALLD
jgi:hypothetical protein